MEDKHSVLKTYFGYDSFRGGQEQLIDGVLAGRDTFGIMPTGGGKSLCYQVPAMLLPGITLVVSPLISLMQDQVIALKNAGIPAAYLNTSLTAEQFRIVYRNIRLGKYRLIYVAPERLMAEGFVALSQELNISHVAVDEAHCISQWGQDFRPSYLKIVDYLDTLPKRPAVSALTATATPAVRKDIVRILKLQNPLTVVTGFDRPNLRFEVKSPQDKEAALLSLVAKRKERSGIIYCNTRKEVESICTSLQQRNFAATRYHAGLTDTERHQNQEDFLYDRKTIMVATNAFGMGIDKSNVSYVIHYNMPKSPEAYYQEAGRAGRDGDKAECILLFAKKDIYTTKFLIQKSYENSDLPPDIREMVFKQDTARMNRMIDYCETPRCLRQHMLTYFGEKAPDECGNCSNCRLAQMQKKKAERKTASPAAPRQSTRVTKDITREAQMILSSISRMNTSLDHSCTVTMLVLVLRGSKQKQLLEKELNKLSTYKLMADYSNEEVRELISYMRDCELITYDKNELVSLLPKAGEVLFRETPVHITLDEEEMEIRFPRSGIVNSDSKLLTHLKKLRAELARKEGIPAELVFTNATLAEMAEKKPGNRIRLMSVSGVTERKAEKYGSYFLETIHKYR